MELKPNLYPANPYQKANALSKIFFWWIFPFMWNGAKGNLSSSAIFEQLPEDSAEKLGDLLACAWEREVEISMAKNKRPKFYMALIKLFWVKYLIMAAITVVSECGIRVVQIVFLHLLLKNFSAENVKEEIYIYGTGIILCTFFYITTFHPPMFSLVHIGMKCRIASSALIYRKAVRLSKASQGEAYVGRLVNLLSNDVNRFDKNMFMLHYIFLGPLQTCIILYLLWTEGQYGARSLAGAGFIIVLIPLQYFNSKLFGKLRRETAKRTDKRGQVMSEIIFAIRVIKMYTWEKPFAAIVDTVRRLEVKILRRTAILKATYLSLFMSASKLISYFTILMYISSGGTISPSNLFLLTTGANFLRMTVVYCIPNAAAHIGELRVVMSRIEDYLLLEEQEPLEAVSLYPTLEKYKVNYPKVVLSGVTSSWTRTSSTLEDISIRLEGDKLVMIFGSVGSGKTSLLHTIISELPISEGKLHIQGRVAYDSQEPWIFTGNLQQNILLGRSFDKARYDNVLEATALKADIQQLPYRDQTVVGERGLALSGGQKARLNLARTLYQEADIYLLDDPLSAVDTCVSRQIFEKCLQEFLSGKLRILATHQLQYLPMADHIIALHEGKIVAQGTYEQLLKSGLDFISLVVNDDEDEKHVSKEVALHGEETSKVGEPEDSAETLLEGSVNAKTYISYFKSGGSNFSVIALIAGFLISQGLFSFSDYWLSYWMRQAEAFDSTSQYNSNHTFFNNLTNGDDFPIKINEFHYNYYLNVYTGIVLSIVVITKLVAILFFIYCMRISINVHDKMLNAVVRSPSSFFDKTPSGRIMNRFTTDIGSMDEMLPLEFYGALTNFFLMIGSLALVVVSNYYLAVPAFILLVALVYMRAFFIKTAREVKRLEARAKSPIYTHVSDTLTGLATIRTSGSQSLLIQQFHAYQDTHSSAWYIYIAVNRWFAVWLEMVSLVFLMVVTYGFILLAEIQDFDSNQVGLAISSCLGLNGVFQWGMRQSAETENLMTSVERAFEYIKLRPEAPLQSSDDESLPLNWPQAGSIEFKNVFVSYGEKDILKNLSFLVKDKEKVGIVGRTGAGKSTIISALFRMTEPRGDIYIDGLKINDTKVGLHMLRNNISIIPQDPILFSGTIRYNLDPFSRYSDDELWRAITEVELKSAIPALDYQVSDGGRNFSVGQRQLVCLARAILRQNKILVMDEATANVDQRTDLLIQKTIRSKFSDCTILTIAHRLQSVMDCDKILVLDNGILKEYDHPHLLLMNEKGIFSEMVNQTERKSSSVIHTLAKLNYETKYIASK